MIQRAVRANRITLGTAQFGMPYGIANRCGQVPKATAWALLDVARANGIDSLDTAVAYGNAEAILGELGVQGWKVTSKLPPIPTGCADVARWMEETAIMSLKRLRIAQFDTLLLHHPRQLVDIGDDVYLGLVRLRATGIARRIGISVYGPEEIASLWPRFAFDVIQAPLNVVDRRLVTSGVLDQLAAAGVAVQARSIFLQGLLVMPAAERPKPFDRFERLWQEWDGWLAAHELTAVQAAVAFALSHDQVEQVVVGVDSVDQLVDLLAASNRTADIPPAALATDDPALINPAQWAAQ